LTKTKKIAKMNLTEKKKKPNWIELNPICLFLSLSLCLSFFLSGWLTVCLSFFLPVCLSLSLCLSLSFSFSVSLCLSAISQ
jgi:hypothetical protein